MPDPQIAVIGGFYREISLRPDQDVWFGSGGRAALALSKAGQVSLHTYVSQLAQAHASALAEGYFQLLPHDAPHPITFFYAHGLAIPKISPRPISPCPSIEVKAEIALQFGMLEGHARVDAEVLVYDPQAPGNPLPFSNTGSSARRLAIVANADEVKGWTGQSDPATGGAQLLHQENAEIVIVKASSAGAYVVDKGGVSQVPAYWTAGVFPIGSGDFFAASFTKFWAVDGLSPNEAADLASRATAMYVGWRCEQIPSSADLRSQITKTTSCNPGQIYLAGPFFTLAQRWLVEEARRELTTAQTRVFSPFHEIGAGPAEVVGPADVAGLEKCDRMFAILDGLDAGTIFEVGYAVKKGIPVFAYAENVCEEDLKMIVGSGCVHISDFASAIYRTIWKQ